MQPNSSGDVNEIVWPCKRHSFRQCLSWNSVANGCCRGCLLCISAVRQMPYSALTWAWEKQAKSLLGQMNKWTLPVPQSQCKSSCKFPAGDSAPSLMGKSYYPTAACSLTLLGIGSCLPPVFYFPVPVTFMGLVFAAGLTGSLLEPGWDTLLFADMEEVMLLSELNMILLERSHFVPSAHLLICYLLAFNSL